MYRDISLYQTHLNFSYDQTLDKRINHSKLSNRKKKEDNSFILNSSKKTKLLSTFSDVRKDSKEDFFDYKPKMYKIIINLYRKHTTDEINKSSDKLHSELKILNSKKDLLRIDYYTKTCPFSPEIINKEAPKVENFYYRLQSWIDKRNINIIK
jgi:hypothetical protein